MYVSKNNFRIRIKIIPLWFTFMWCNMLKLTSFLFWTFSSVKPFEYYCCQLDWALILTTGCNKLLGTISGIYWPSFTNKDKSMNHWSCHNLSAGTGRICGVEIKFMLSWLLQLAGYWPETERVLCGVRCWYTSYMISGWYIVLESLQILLSVFQKTILKLLELSLMT